MERKLDVRVGRLLSNIKHELEEIKIFAEENGVKFEMKYLSNNDEECIDFQQMFPSKFHFIYDRLGEE
jgi:hypothetical protein